MQRTPENFRAQADVDELWDGMCQSAIALISSALHSVNNDGKLLKVKVRDLEGLLVEARSSSSEAGPITLKALGEFQQAKKKAETRIFELVNSKIDDLIETAEYDWSSTYVPDGASPYMQELTRYLSNILSSVLIGLPEKIKEQIYEESLGHASSSLLSLPLDPGVRAISAQAVTAYSLDVGHLTTFVQGFGKSEGLLQRLEELRQTTELMKLAAQGRGEEYFDTSISHQAFNKVDKIKGVELVAKVTPAKDAASMLTAATGGSRSASPALGEAKKTVAVGFGNIRDRIGNLTQGRTN
ncbi:hypothetical protein MRB53_038832 [Persea americana]|nr:hypothetical protein MRB53_038832 [Persea americana]